MVRHVESSLRFIEPIVRPRPLLWATAAFGLLLSLSVVTDSSVSPLARLVMPLVLPASLVMTGTFVHGACLIFLRGGAAGDLGCPNLLPSDDLARSLADRTEWSRRNAHRGTSPLGLLAAIAWLAPEPITWRDQIALTSLVLWRPLPALLVAPALIGIMLFLAIWDWVFGWKEIRETTT